MADGAPMVFLEKFEHVLDSQCRVSLPSSWRNRDGETELVLLPTREKALVLLPLDTFMEFVGRAGRLAIANPRMQMALSRIGARSKRCRCDRQGRIVLDRAMLDSIDVADRLVMVGSVTHIRLCSPQVWEEYDRADISGCLDEIQRVCDGDDGLAGLLSLLGGKGNN